MLQCAVLIIAILDCVLIDASCRKIYLAALFSVQSAHSEPLHL
jgi:hypothetical protein